MPYAGPRAALYLDPLNTAMAEFEIDTPEREAAFLANVAHESGSLKYVEELASGQDYEGRAVLGNTEPGDGVRFKGRGLMQITGRANYLRCSQALFGDDRLIDNPELLEEPTNAARSAAWFWRAAGCNTLADQGQFGAIVRRINGGLNGLPERLALWKTAQDVLA